MIKGIIFDKDGTLFSFAETWGAWCERLVEELSPHDEALQQELAEAVGYDKRNRSFAPGSSVVNASADETMHILSGLLPGKSAAQIEAVGLRLLDALPLHPVTDLQSLFTALAGSGIVLGVATNDYEAVARDHLTQLSVIDKFDFVCGFDSGYGSKPEPGMIYAFCEHTGCDPHEVAMVGDSTHDLRAGRAAGVGLAVGVLTGPAEYADLIADAHAVVSDISVLPELIQNYRSIKPS